MAVDSSGRIVVAGSSGDYFAQRFAVARLNPDGSLDNTFASGGEATLSFGTNVGERDDASSVALDSAGHIVLAGSTYSYSAEETFAVARLNADGSLDSSFNGTGKVTMGQFGNSGNEPAFASSEAIDSSGNIVVAGAAYGPFTDGYGERFALARLTARGALDSSFGNSGTTTVTFSGGSLEYDSAAGVALDPSGHIVVAGTSVRYYPYYTGPTFAVARLNSDGSLDASFAGSGKTTVGFSGYDENAAGVALDGSGHVVVAGTVNRTSTATWQAIGVTRLNADGSVDGAWGSGGLVATSITGASLDIAADMTITQPDGKIVVVGLSTPQASTANLAVTRYNSDGTLDSAFGQSGKAVIGSSSGMLLNPSSVSIDGSGRIDIAGAVTTNQGPSVAVVRLNSDGSLDTTFGTGGESVLSEFGGSAYWAYNSATGLAIDSSGRIVLAGTAQIYAPNYATKFAVARLNADGSLDTSFANGGESTLSFSSNGTYESESASGLVIDASGRIIVAGTTETNSGPEFAVAPLNRDGSFDNSFASGGKTTIGLPSGTYGSNEAVGVALDPAGRIIVGGSYNAYSPNYIQGFMVARLNPADGSLDQNVGVGGQSTISPTAASGQFIYAAPGRLAIDGSGRVAVVGEVVGSDPNYYGPDIAVGMFNTNGCC